MKQIDDILKELFKDFFKDYDISQPQIKGKAFGHILKRMCTFHECQKSSLHCDDESCEKSYHEHYLCKNITMNGITDLLKQHFKANKEFLAKMFDVEDALMNDITKKRDEIVKRMSFGNLQDKYQKIIEEIYRKGNGEYLKGKQADQFFKKLLFLSKTKNNAASFLQKFAAAAQQAFKDITVAKETALNEYLASIKQVNYVAASVQDFDSLILKKDDPEFKQKINFIFDSLEKPKGLQLIFRASQNQFSAANYYDKCNGIAKTLTIIRTQFGKTIGAYNHQHCTSTSGGYTFDNQKKCFLLSIELKQKMIITNYQNAISNNASYGPTFGGGHDIYLSDKCNENNCSYTNFPHSYNLASNPYTNNQASHTAFCGAASGKNFKVIEYEVYKVIR